METSYISIHLIYVYLDTHSTLPERNYVKQQLKKYQCSPLPNLMVNPEQ